MTFFSSKKHESVEVANTSRTTSRLHYLVGATAIGLALVLSGPAQTQTYKVPIEPDYQVLRIDWKHTSWETYVLYFLKPHGTKTLACGAYAQIGGLPADVQRRVLTNLYLKRPAINLRHILQP